jgi:hypothetical protein
VLNAGSTTGARVEIPLTQADEFMDIDPSGSAAPSFGDETSGVTSIGVITILADGETSVSKANAVSSYDMPQLDTVDVLMADTVQKTPLFALVIGINEYKNANNNLKSLKGCVSDANNIERFLIDDLHVPQENIKNLRDQAATRAEIMHSLKELARNESIRKDDPILIYFAGHGARVNARLSRTETKIIEMLCPYDFIPGKTETEAGQGIADITFGTILHNLAKEKGDNIVCLTSIQICLPVYS